MRLFNLTSNQVVSTNIKQAYSFISRLKGLMFTKELNAACGLHMKPCRSIHTFFMKYSIDVLYLDKENRVIAIEEKLSPGKVGSYYPGADSAVELPSGAVEKTGVKAGHKVKFCEQE